MDIEVVYANAHRQIVIPLDLPPGAELRQALDLAAQDPRLLDVDLSAHAVGVYGEVCEPQRVLQPGDRVEIYRELVMDAKTARRKRAMQQGQNG